MNDDLAAFVTGGTDQTALRALFAGPAFDRPQGLTAAQSHEHMSELVRSVTSAAGPAASLLADRTRLTDLMGWAATRDPVLFHALLLHYCLCLNGIAEFSPDPVRALAAVEERGDIGVLLMTEAGRSGSHRAIRTEARYDPAAREFVLRTPDATAVKFPTAAGLASVSRTALVYARLVVDDADCGVFAFEIRFGGAHGRPEGMRIAPTPEVTALPVDYAAVAFAGTRLPFDAWLADSAAIGTDGRFSDPLGTREARLSRSMGVGTRTWTAMVAGCAAFTRAACAIAVRYARTRLTSDTLSADRPLIGHRFQQVELLTALADAYALTALANHAKQRTDAPTAAAGSTWAPWSAVDATLPLLKAVASETAERVAHTCRERSGALAYAGTPLLLAHQNTAHAYLSAGGDNALIRFDTARAMCDEGFEPPEDAAPQGIRVTDDFLRLARACEHRLRAKLTERVTAKDGDPFEAWDGALALGAEAAAVRAERLLMEHFAAAAAASGPDARAALERLLIMHGIGWARRRAAALTRCGLLTGAALESLEDLAHRTCDLLLPRLADLVDAFGLDEEYLGTFMAADDHLAAFAAQHGFTDL
ncbi:acyl-CoA dehydrogenase family protein [Glycomyces tritici]|uniref:Acyl-CoA dehydrogenase n=1 Tax=Glycomyces tritici TaxID=2665176 RepID=A0ABT7YWR8_9ACTN|nr:acyl-CoA dehydrogenase [Glycomyces tritici]MDN3243088.1 acyl-CoA dehydrogenase [Glycomyces tritici]